MPSGYKTVSGSGGPLVDLDSIFAARAGSSPHANVGFKVAGVDISDRYYAATGGDTIGFNTKYKVGASDLSAIFRNINYAAATPTPTPTPTATPTATPIPPTATPTPTPTATPTPTPTNTPTATPTPTPVPVAITYALFSPHANYPIVPAYAGLYNNGDNLTLTHTGNDGTAPVTSRLWFTWNGGSYVSSGVTTATFNIGSGPYAGTPDDMGGGVFRYYYTLQLSNAAGTTDYTQDIDFGIYVDVQF